MGSRKQEVGGSRKETALAPLGERVWSFYICALVCRPRPLSPLGERVARRPDSLHRDAGRVRGSIGVANLLGWLLITDY